MGDRINLNNSSWEVLEALLDTFVEMYARSEEEFYKMFIKANSFKRIEEIAKVDPDVYKDSDYEEIAELAREVYFYYTSYKRKLKRIKKDRSPIFTLRNSEDLAIFEEFLDKMLKLRDLSEKHFIQLFPKCPAVFWDKIDDLRETSYKLDRDSKEYTRCLKKCKKLSFDFSELSGTNTSNYE